MGYARPIIDVAARPGRASLRVLRDRGRREYTRRVRPRRHTLAPLVRPVRTRVDDRQEITSLAIA